MVPLAVRIKPISSSEDSEAEVPTPVTTGLRWSAVARRRHARRARPDARPEREEVDEVEALRCMAVGTGSFWILTDPKSWTLWLLVVRDMLGALSGDGGRRAMSIDCYARSGKGRRSSLWGRGMIFLAGRAGILFRVRLLVLGDSRVRQFVDVGA